MEFFSEKTVNGRKQHRCDSCQQVIENGASHVYMSGKFEGEIWDSRNHHECRKAEVKLAKVHGLSGGEEWMFLHDLEEDADVVWVKEVHPEAYAHIVDRYAERLEQTNVPRFVKSTGI